MKVALIGKGKTGSKVLDLHPKDLITVYDRSNPVTVEKLSQQDVAIIFTPSEALFEIFPTLLESKILVVSGATGAIWPESLQSQLKQAKLSWISGSNFSLGMRIVHQMIKNLSKATKLFEEFDIKIHEVHHTKKLDGPSGTALSWKKWVDHEAQITFERTGDVVGDHQLTFETNNEKISLQHQALDRKIFAQGALWSAKYLFKNHQELPYGINYFEDITEKLLH